MVTYYVNPSSGSDTNPGTLAGPFATREKALLEAVPGDWILVARGYKYGSLQISSKDGTLADQYNWGAYGIGADPIFSAFIDPSGSWVNEGSNIWSYTNAGFSEVTILSVSGANQQISRWPKRATAEYYTIDAAIDDTQITDNTNLSGQPSYVGGEVVSKKRKWTIDRSIISAQSSNTLTVIGDESDYNVGNGYFVQNHVNACTQQGDWAFNAANDKVYFYSTVDPDTLDIQISFDQYALEVSSSDYHSFSDIVFEGAYDYNIYLSFSNNVTFTNCTSRLAGKNGLQTFVSENATWVDGAMYDINNTGINVRDASPGLTVIDSSFVRIAAIPGMGLGGSSQQCGIHFNNTEHDGLVDGNFFFQIGNCGVYYRGNNCYVGHNYAEKCGFTVSDAAAFYTFGNFSTPYTNIICEYNIAYDCIGNIDGIAGPAKYDTCGFYSDDNCRNVIKRYNYARKCGYCYYIHNNQDVSYYGNIGIDGSKILYISDDNSQGSSTTLRVRNIDVQNNIFKALAGQDVISLRTLGVFSGDDPFGYGVINNNQLDAVEANPFLVDLTSNYLTYFNLADWRSTYGFDINSNTTPYDDSKTIFLANDDPGPVTFPLTKTYRDWDNKYYRFGEITLEGYESKLLFETGELDTKVGTIFFQEDWESGGVANWNENGEVDTSYIPATGDSSVSTEQALSGQYSLKMTSDNDLGQTNNFRYTEPNNNNEFLATMHFYFPEKIDLANNFDSYFNLVQTKGINEAEDELPERNDPIWVLGLGVRGGKGSGGNNYLTLAYLGQFWDELGFPQESQTPLQTIDIPIGQWFKVQIRYLKSETDGIIQVWQDDVLLFEKEQAITFPDSLVARLYMSVNNYGEQRIPSSGETTVYMDDFYISSYQEGEPEPPEPVGLVIKGLKFVIGN